MYAMTETVSIAIETSCRRGGCALGLGQTIVASIAFDASQRHTAMLLGHMDSLLKQRQLRPADLNEVYISAGPGSFTGLRVGVTVARTLVQAIAHVRCVAVPTAQAVAQNAAGMEWERLAVVMDAGEGFIYGTFFTRQAGQIVQAGPSTVLPAAEFAAQLPGDILLIGEGLHYHLPALQAVCGAGVSPACGAGVPPASRCLPRGLPGEGIRMLPEDSPLNFPTAEGVWAVGRQLAQAGQYTDYHQLLPIYSRAPQALRAWEQKQSNKT